MAGREQPYDPYIPSGGSGQGGSAGYDGGNTRTAAIQSVRAYMSCGYHGSRCAVGWLRRSKCLASTLPTSLGYNGHSYTFMLCWFWDCPYESGALSVLRCTFSTRRWHSITTNPLPLVETARFATSPHLLSPFSIKYSR